MTTIPQNPQDHITRAVGHVLAIIDLLKAFDTGAPDTIEHARQVHDISPEAVARLIRSELTHRVGGSATLLDLLARYESEPDIIDQAAPIESPAAKKAMQPEDAKLVALFNQTYKAMKQRGEVKSIEDWLRTQDVYYSARWFKTLRDRYS